MHEYTQEEINLITLGSFEELTYNGVFTLLSDLQKSQPDFVKYRNNLIKSFTDGVYNKVRDKFYDEDYRRETLENLEKKGITCVTVCSENYPEALLNTPRPPITLYCKGNLQLLSERCFSIVGSRRTPPNALKECKNISRELSRKFVIVTGMADGADSAAAEGALAEGRVISVLAYGFDYSYPAFNEALIRKVGEKGLLVSEYAPHTPPRAFQFPIRNRIIAGLSEGTLVVSAGKKSGALITADYCAEYGRQAFAFPYSIGVSAGEGCNELIRNGAVLVRSAADIFDEFGIKASPADKIQLTDEERQLLEAIRAEGEAFVPALAEKLGKPAYALIPQLTVLEVKGVITRLGGNRYSANG